MTLFQCNQCGKQTQNLEGWTMHISLGSPDAHFDTVECRDEYIMAEKAKEAADAAARKANDPATAPDGGAGT